MDLYYDHRAEGRLSLSILQQASTTATGLLGELQPSGLLENSTIEEEMEANNNNNTADYSMATTNPNTSSVIPTGSDLARKKKSWAGGADAGTSRSKNCLEFEQVEQDLPERPMSTASFLGHVKEQSSASQRGMESVGLQDPWRVLKAIAQEVIKGQEKDLHASLDSINEIKKYQSEKAELEGRVKKLQSELEEAKLTHAKIRRKCADQLEKAKKDDDASRKRKDKHQKKLDEQKKKFNEKKLKIDQFEKRYQQSIDQRDAQNELLEKLGLKFISCNAGDSLDGTVSSEGSSYSAETMIEMKNVNPRNPEEPFYIRMDTFSVSEKRFSAKNVHPNFEEAYDVVKAANESQDFIQFLLDCKTYWLRNLELNLSQNVGDCDESRALFDSPVSLPANGKDDSPNNEATNK